MPEQKVSLSEAVKFHGHLGPWLVLGLLLGELALKKLKAKKHFGLRVKAWGLNKRPKSCLIDGLQLSTGATYGKGNIQKLNSNEIKVAFFNLDNKRRLICMLDEGLESRLNQTKNHKANKQLARKIYRLSPDRLFKIKV